MVKLYLIENDFVTKLVLLQNNFSILKRIKIAELALPSLKMLKQNDV